ncbi:Protein phosphatase 2C [Quillaja saponaria]|uniref:protein-serine/threonine phosphatase n=1 Tax=Quillaja saponaria TaxID=32244 RepID=A0AAD7KZ27_QUISA|nr:Protein phosphatase 2C [Quillaja saponaria]
MADICCEVVSESEASSSCKPRSRAARRRRIESRRFKFVTGVAPQGEESQNEDKIQKVELQLNIKTPSFSRDCEKAVENCVSDVENRSRSEVQEKQISCFPISTVDPDVLVSEYPKFGVASVCGRRREMEDAVAIHPSFGRRDNGNDSELHYFGVYDGHGCSHVATKCRDRLHELVKEELESDELCLEWKTAMERSFSRMDKEVIAWNESVTRAKCRCELQSPDCDAVGSTAVVAILTPYKIIVANCGDSRAVLCRNGKAVPLSSDHKPDRPDELNRIQEAGGRVIYWDGARVLGMLAMSRAIGDNYLKPYVSCEPEVTIIDRTAEDECLILASDGLWDVVSNETVCSVARMCIRGKGDAPPRSTMEMDCEIGGEPSATCDKACSDASVLLTKLALARRTTDNVSVVVVDLRRDT